MFHEELMNTFQTKQTFRALMCFARSIEIGNLYGAAMGWRAADLRSLARRLTPRPADRRSSRDCGTMRNPDQSPSTGGG